MRLVRTRSSLLALAFVTTLTLVAVPEPALAGASGQPSSGSRPVVAEQRTALELAAEAYALEAHNDQRRAGRTRNGRTYGDVSAQPAMQAWSDMMTVSRRWSDQFHYGQMAHNPDFGGQYGYWSSAAENISVHVIKRTSSGMPTTAQVRQATEDVMQSWWESESHRRNWMSPKYDDFSVGMSIQKRTPSFDDEPWWVLSATVNFRDSNRAIPSTWRTVRTDGRTPPNEVTGTTRFSDVPSWHVFHDDIDAIARAGITSGCGGGRYCPDDPVTRGQMAAFLDRALGLRNSTRTFSDSRGHVFEDSIAALARAGVTKGCNPPSNTRFCPDRPVTRAQMAAFLDRALGLPDGTTTFDDTRRSIYRSNISALARAGVTKGCNPPRNSRFCPGDIVTRAQMAAFLVRAGLA